MPIGSIANTEAGSSVRGKLNEAISKVNALVGTRLTGRYRWPKGLTVASGSNLGANVIALVPFVVDETFTISELFFSISTLAAGGNVQVAIYAADSVTLMPTGDALGATASQVTDATGVFTKAVTPFQVAPGLYWMAVNADNSTVALLTPSTGLAWSSSLIGSATLTNVRSGTTAITMHWTIAQTFGTWPDLTGGAFTEATNNKCGVLGFKTSSVP